jgi:hypothetical protein
MSVVLSDRQLAAEIGDVLRQIRLQQNDFRWRETAFAWHAVTGHGMPSPSPRKRLPPVAMSRGRTSAP